MLKPLRSNVLLQPTSTEAQSASGLIIASAVSNEATVIACGSEVKELKVGDQVRYDSSSVTKLDGLLMCREADVYCVVE